jgi:hypothetical protein
MHSFRSAKQWINEHREDIITYAREGRSVAGGLLGLDRLTGQDGPFAVPRRHSAPTPTAQPYEAVPTDPPTSQSAIAGQALHQGRQPSFNNGTYLPFSVLLTTPLSVARRRLTVTGNSIAQGITNLVPAEHRADVRSFRNRVHTIANGPQDPSEAQYDPYFGTPDQTPSSEKARPFLPPYNTSCDEYGGWIEFEPTETESQEYPPDVRYRGRTLEEVQRTRLENDRYYGEETEPEHEPEKKSKGKALVRHLAEEETFVDSHPRAEVVNANEEEDQVQEEDQDDDGKEEGGRIPIRAFSGGSRVAAVKQAIIARARAASTGDD